MKTERMTGDDFNEAVSILGHGRLTERWQCRLAEEIQQRDLDATKKDAEIAQLKADLERLTKESDSLRAELDRLKPSGQVADDFESVRLLLGGSSSPALIRIAAQAQAAQVLAEALDAFAGYVTKHAGHEERCRGWRRPVKDKSAPAWKRRGEWMDLSACTCGPGELLKRAASALSLVRKP